MTRFALVSDIHGNTTGLHAVLEFLDRQGSFDAFFALGDILGGGSGADEVIELLLQRNAIMVKGNHELLQLDFEKYKHHISEQFSQLMPAVDEWLYKHLSPEYWRILEDLPLTHEVEITPDHKLLVCHATPNDPWEYACRPDTPPHIIDKYFGNVQANIIAYGHFHEHHVMQYDGKIMINVASVGLRPDGLSACTILDFINKTWSIRQFQVPYDTDAEEQLMRLRGVPRPDW